MKRIFGANNYTIVDHMDRLPEKLPALFASLTRWPQQIVVATGAR